MTPLAWTIIGVACLALAVSLLLFAWRIRHQDALWQRITKAPTPLPLCCKVGVEEISRTTINGSWTCPSCGRFHTFVDGQPGKIDL
jgi:hypothetical protein